MDAGNRHQLHVPIAGGMEFLKLRRQSEDVVSLEEDHGGFSRLTSTNTAEEVSHLHHCSPCSRVGDASCSMEELEFSEQNSSAAMDSVRSAFSTFEARSNFSKLRQELVHRQRMIDAVSRRHRRALTGKARPGAEGAVVPAPRFSRAEAGKAKEASDEPRQRDVTGSPKRTELKDVRPIQELKGWKKRNLRGSKADSFNERKVAAQSPSRRKAMEMRETAHQPAPCEDRWESVKHSATFSRSPNLEAVMVQRSWRKQMIRSLRQQPMVPMVEVKDLYDLLNDPQSWRLSSSQRCPMEGWTDEQTEAVPLPRSSNASPAPHRPARRFSRPIKRSERPATVGPSTFQLPQDLEETVWSVVDLSS